MIDAPQCEEDAADIIPDYRRDKVSAKCSTTDLTQFGRKRAGGKVPGAQSRRLTRQRQYTDLNGRLPPTPGGAVEGRLAGGAFVFG